MQKNGSFLSFRAGSLWQGHRKRGDSDPGAHGNDTDKSVCGISKTFFIFGDHIKIRKKMWHFPLLFWSSQSRRCPIFELILGPCLALGAPANTVINKYIYCFSWQIISCSLISLLIIAVRNFQRFSDRSFVTEYDPIIILKLD